MTDLEQALRHLSGGMAEMLRTVLQQGFVLPFRLVAVAVNGSFMVGDYTPNADGSGLVDAAGAVIGFAQLRHRPSCSADLPAEAGNHVYYDIAEPYRSQGHGKVLLGLMSAAGVCLRRPRCVPRAGVGLR